MNDDSTVPDGQEPDTGDALASGDEDRTWGEYQMEPDDCPPEEAGYGYGV